MNEVNTSGSSGATAGWWNKYSNKRLLTSFMFTLFAVNLLSEGGVNKIGFFLAGLLAGTFVGILEWRSGMRAIDKLAHQGTVRYSDKAKLAIVITIILALILFWYSIHLYIREEVLAFTSGLFILGWVKYFEIMSWEKKNRKTLIKNKTSFLCSG